MSSKGAVRRLREVLNMVPVFSLLVALALSFVIVRVATVALVLTGLSRESARFQSRSAFTGVGFTTTEAETIVGHPVRRRIVMLLMMLGNAGLVTVVASLMLSFLGNAQERNGWLAMGLLVGGVVTLMMIARSQWIERRMSRIIEWALRKWTDLDAKDYANLLRLSSGFGVVEFHVESDHAVSGKTLLELPLKENGIIVLGIHKANGTYLGAPRGTHRFEVGDTAIVYGRAKNIDALCRHGHPQLEEENETSG